MKKINNILLILFISVFAFLGNIKATSSINCTPTSITVGDSVICSIKTDEPVEISSKLDIVAGDTTMNKDGNIVYKATSKGTYYVYMKTVTPGFNDRVVISVNEKTTTTKATTTTTKKQSSNNFLKLITVDGKTLVGFSKDKTKYYISVENDINKVSLDAKTEDENAILEINGPKVLEVGDNEYTIGVTAEDNSTKFYKIIVTRAEEAKSSNTDIKSIKIKGYNLSFDKSSKTFYLNVAKEDTELDITVKTDDKNANYEIKDNENLKDGSEIKIIVTAEDGKKDTYRIIIQKNDKNIMPIIIGAVISFIVILIIVIVLLKKKKDNGKTDDKKDVEKNNISNEEYSKSKDASKISYENEKTIEMPPISGSNVLKKESLENDIHIDNDEEATRMFNYESENNSYLQDEDITNKINETIEKSLSFDDDEDI